MISTHFTGGCCGRGHHGGCHNTGKLVRFASGVVPVVLSSLADGVVGIPSIIGCGTAVTGVISADGNIYSACPANEARRVRKAGKLTTISASFTVTTPFDVAGQDETVTATIYRAPAGSNVFSPTTASVDLAPVLTSLLPLGTTLTGTKSLMPQVAVAAGDCLLMVYTMSGTTGDVAAVVTGTASASVTIGGVC